MAINMIRSDVFTFIFLTLLVYVCRSEKQLDSTSSRDLLKKNLEYWNFPHCIFPPKITYSAGRVPILSPCSTTLEEAVLKRDKLNVFVRSLCTSLYNLTKQICGNLYDKKLTESTINLLNEDVNNDVCESNEMLKNHLKERNETALLSYINFINLEDCKEMCIHKTGIKYICVLLSGTVENLKTLFEGPTKKTEGTSNKIEDKTGSTVPSTGLTKDVNKMIETGIKTAMDDKAGSKDDNTGLRSNVTGVSTTGPLSHEGSAGNGSTGGVDGTSAADTDVSTAKPATVPSEEVTKDVKNNETDVNGAAKTETTIANGAAKTETTIANGAAKTETTIANGAGKTETTIATTNVTAAPKHGGIMPVNTVSPASKNTEGVKDVKTTTSKVSTASVTKSGVSPSSGEGLEQANGEANSRNGEVHGKGLGAGYTSDEPEPPGSGNFMAYFLTVVVLCIAGYVVFHNKQKIIGFIVEGRASQQRRRTSGGGKYKKLESNVEEVIPSLDRAASTKNFIY